MKVKILYIINHGLAGLGPDDETMAVCKGLYLKHKGRCDAVGVFRMTILDALEAEPGLLNGPLPLKEGAPERDKIDAVAAQDLLGKAPAKAQGEKRSVGVYIVSHGPGAFAPNPAVAADSIDALLPADAKPKLHYVAVVACKLADAVDAEGTFDLNRDDATYMMKFMKELNARQMRPVAAGWDVFVSAAPHQPMSVATPTKPAKPLQVYHQGQTTDVQTIPGKKFVTKTSSTYQTVATEGNEYRKKHKHLYLVTNGNQLRVALGTWSSFTQ